MTRQTKSERDVWLSLLAGGLPAVAMAGGLGYLMSRWSGAFAIGGTTLGLLAVTAVLHIWMRKHPQDPDEGWRRLSRWGYVAGLGSGGWNPRVPERESRKAEGDTADNHSDRS